MKKFNLSEYLENPSREVMTRERRKVRIICWDRKDSKYPIIGLISNENGLKEDGCCFYAVNGDAYGDACYDLFFADEEKGLTEFEKAMQEYYFPEIDDFELKRFAKGILDLARKEIEKDIEHSAVEFAKSYMEDVNPSFEKVKESEELWKWKMSCLRGINKAYTKGKQDALKDLPKWKKATEDKDFDRHVLLLEDDRVVIASCVYKDEYYIELNNLRTLPKEE